MSRIRREVTKFADALPPSSCCSPQRSPKMAKVELSSTLAIFEQVFEIKGLFSLMLI
jgi:hypothetical protein